MIHYCVSTNKNSVYVSCLSWAGVVSGPTKDPEVYDADFDDNLWCVLYTSNPNKVSCPKCLKLMALNKQVV